MMEMKKKARETKKKATEAEERREGRRLKMEEEGPTVGVGESTAWTKCA